MNSYRFYEFIKEKCSGDYDEVQLSKEEIKERVLHHLKQSRVSFRVRSGEMYTFNDKAFVSDVRKILDKKDDDSYILDLTCGDLLVGYEPKGGGDPRNYFLDLFKERSDDKKNDVHVRYNPLVSYEQIAYCYFHSFVFDDDRFVWFEEPHGYRTDESDQNRTWLIFKENSKVYTKYLSDMIASYDNWLCISDDSFSIFDNKIIKEVGDNNFFEKTSEFAFNSKEEYLTNRKKWFNETDDGGLTS